MVRPYDLDELTHVHTELKLLQIDLVSVLSILNLNPLNCNYSIL